MVNSKCANNSCSAVCHRDEGKLFRLDINLANAAGENECKTLYVWLCSRCAGEMNPKVEVAGDTVTVLLASTKRGALPARTSAHPWVN